MRIANQQETTKQHPHTTQKTKDVVYIWLNSKKVPSEFRLDRFIVNWVWCGCWGSRHWGCRGRIECLPICSNNNSPRGRMPRWLWLLLLLLWLMVPWRMAKRIPSFLLILDCCSWSLTIGIVMPWLLLLSLCLSLSIWKPLLNLHRCKNSIASWHWVLDL